MQQYVRVEKDRLENAERRADSFMKAMVEANERVARLRKALEWYADEENYNDEHAPVVRGFIGETFDEGRKARQALEN